MSFLRFSALWGAVCWAVASAPALAQTSVKDADARQVHEIHDVPSPVVEAGAPLLRDPHAYSNGLHRGEGIYVPAGMPHLMMADEHRFAALRVDTLERRFARKGQDSTAYGLKAWYGNSYDKLLLKAEGEFAKEKLEDARTELLWGHAVSPFWDAQLGIRLDHGEGPGRQWLAAGLEGLAPYWFDLEATAYLSSGGRTALRLEASYELLLTQRLILTPKAEMQLYGKEDPKRGLGRGLAHVSAGLRLRYEFTRQFAPYVGVDWVGSFGQTADNKRAAGMSARQTRWVAGLRFWF